MMVALGALAVLAVQAPAQASAGSLLSGYGGPGQGSQAILGSTLLNNSSGGGGGGAGSSSSSQGAGSPAVAGAVGTSPAARSRSGASKPAAAGKESKGRAAVPSRAGSSSRSAAPAPAAPAQNASVDSPTLGLSGADLLYILIGLGALATTAAVTRIFARSPG